TSSDWIATPNRHPGRCRLGFEGGSRTVPARNLALPASIYKISGPSEGRLWAIDCAMPTTAARSDSRLLTGDIEMKRRKLKIFSSTGRPTGIARGPAQIVSYVPGSSWRFGDDRVVIATQLAVDRVLVRFTADDRVES